MRSFIPPRSDAAEILDGPVVDRRLLHDNLRDMARANRWLGANRAIGRRVADWLSMLPPDHTPAILDVATGGGDLPMQLLAWSARRERPINLLASDLSAEIMRIARDNVAGLPIQLLQHDALALPFADRSVDIVTCTQALHHFRPESAIRLLRELARVARVGVIVSDLRRSYLAYWGARLLAVGPVSPLSRHDGPLSVLRAYTPAEVAALLKDVALPGQVRSVPGFRLEVLIENHRPAIVRAQPREEDSI